MPDSGGRTTNRSGPTGTISYSFGGSGSSSASVPVTVVRRRARGCSASAGSTSSRFSRVEDGRLDACQTLEQTSAKPPSNCGALIRLHLVPIGAGTPGAAVATAAPETSCPEGMVLSEGKCTKPAAGVVHECKKSDVQDCTLQCDKGDRASCQELGRLYTDGASGVAKDPTRARALFDKATDGGLSLIEKILAKQPKTKLISEVLTKIHPEGKILLVDETFEDNTQKATRNIERVQMVDAATINAWHLVRFDRVLVSEQGFQRILARANAE